MDAQFYLTTGFTDAGGNAVRLSSTQFVHLPNLNPPSTPHGPGYICNGSVTIVVPSGATGLWATATRKDPTGVGAPVGVHVAFNSGSLMPEFPAVVSGNGITQNGRATFDLYATAKSPISGLLQARLMVWAPGTAYFHGGVFYGNTFNTLNVSNNMATLTGAGTWNGKPNYTFSVTAVDDNRPSLTSVMFLRTRDNITITIWDASHAMVFTTSDELKSGGVAVHW